MIRLDMKAWLECDHAGCGKAIRCTLVLLPTGSFAPQLPPEAFGRWQLFADPKNPMAPFKGCCPEHREGRILTATVVPA
jgi:hypothetical protein